YIIIKEFLVWPFIVLFSLIAFIQIMALQYFVRRFYLEPNNMSLGQYLRHIYDRRKNKQQRMNDDFIPVKSWYDNLDSFQSKVKEEMKEQSDQLFAQFLDQYNLELPDGKL
ncbi:MAG: hypothetical protein ACFFDW_17775, partial [Candidatus Thorarchaeota archaeon]